MEKKEAFCQLANKRLPGASQRTRQPLVRLRSRIFEMQNEKPKKFKDARKPC